MTLATGAGALAQLALFGLTGWAVAGWTQARLGRGAPGLPERALYSVAGGVAFAVACMVAHLVTAGAVFASPWVVPAAAVAVVAGARRHLGAPGSAGRRPVLALGVLLAALYVAPVVAGGSSIRTGDPPWHLGWSEQLLAGEPVPNGPAPEYGRNAYPWGLHAVIATMVRLVPGTDPAVAHEALHLLVVFAVPLGAACIARLADPRAGPFAAAACALIGGFAGLTRTSPDFVASPSEARYGADLVVASPNSVYELFPPGLPRELGLVLLAAAACALAASAARRDRTGALAAGAAAGLVGLVSIPLFVTAMAWLAVTHLRSPRRLGAAAGAATAVFALWAGPVAAYFVRYGGFVDITPRLGVEWPLPVALASWGLLLPLAAAGVWAARRSQPAVLLAVSVVMLGAAIARGALDWGLAGNATLLHQGRVWPVLHLLGAAFAGIALVRIAARFGAPGRVAVLAILVVGMASPVMASLRVRTLLESDSAGFEYARADVAEGSFVRRAAEVLGPSDVVEVQGPPDLAFRLFEFSGTRLASYDDPRLERNELRIRYRDLARAWDRRIAAGGFEADYLVQRAPVAGARALVSGSYEGVAYALVRVTP